MDGKRLAAGAAVAGAAALGAAAAIHLRGRRMGAEHAPVDGYGRRLEIWGERVPGNRPESKLADMDIGPGRNPFLAWVRFFTALSGKKFRDRERVADTFTYLYEIRGGYELPTYEDRPYLVPYLAPGSRRAVLILPGGGFGYKSMDGEYGESRDVARALLRHGVSSFVLHYRSNPYEFPIPLLDLQRAVRYVRSRAGDFGLDPEGLSLLGYSAGGGLAAGFLGLVQGRSAFPEGYVPDGVDALDDSVAAAALIYPGVTHRHSPAALFCLFDADAVRDPERREELLELTDLKRYVGRWAHLPQFVAWGTRDRIVGRGPAEYVRAARAAGAEVTEAVARGQDHAFGQRHYMPQYLAWLDRVLPAGTAEERGHQEKE